MLELTDLMCACLLYIINYLNKKEINEMKSCNENWSLNYSEYFHSLGKTIVLNGDVIKWLKKNTQNF